MNNLSEDIINKFLLGECSEGELKEVNTWINESDENARQFFRMEEIYYLGKDNFAANEKKTDRAQKKLHERISAEKFNQKKVIRMHTWMKYAAVVIFLILTGTGAEIWFHKLAINNDLMVVSSNGTVKEVKLPDGTKVWLNELATLKYPREFSNNERKVFLDGEAYFEVTKNPEKPFIVQSDIMSVKVLGTTFNFKSGKVHSLAEASLIEGRIEVRGNREEGLITLFPGQKAELDCTTGRLVVKQVNTKFDAVWHNNLIPFEKSTIDSIAEALERFYNVKIILSPDMNITSTYSGVLKRKDSIESVLKSLKNAIPIQYKIVGNNIFIYEQEDNCR